MKLNRYLMTGKKAVKPKAKPAKKQKKKKALDPVVDFEEPVKRKPRQARLPGTEDPEIEELEALAEEHSETLGEIREQREELKRIQTALSKAMRRLGKKTYSHGGIVLKLREGLDKVSVKVKRHDVEDAPEQQPEQQPDQYPEIGEEAPEI